jgi:hypothetical protein
MLQATEFLLKCPVYWVLLLTLVKEEIFIKHNNIMSELLEHLSLVQNLMHPTAVRYMVKEIPHFPPQISHSLPSNQTPDLRGEKQATSA